MSAIGLLLGLLVLSYLGSNLVGKRVIQGLGLPSGAEYLFLGFILGSHVLGVIPQSLLITFEPLLVVGASWVAFVAGTSYTLVGERRVALGRTLLGVVATLVVAIGVGAVVWFALPWFYPRLLPDRVLCAGGIAIVSCASTRQAVRWVVLRYGASGPLSDGLADYARTSALVPMLGISLLLAQFPDPGMSVVPFLGRVAITWGIGALLGLVALLLVGRGLTRDETWGILVGTSLLAMGVAARLGLSPVAAAFAMGLCIGVFSKRRVELAALVRPTERAVILPLAVLAGALVNLREAPALALLVPLALVGRLVFEVLRGALLALFSKPARRAWPGVGFCLVSTGEVSVACAVSVVLSFKTPAALCVLAVAVANVLVGELIAPIALRRSLASAGELSAESSSDWSRVRNSDPGGLG